jgi:archaeal cell division control protein 6
MSDNWFRPEASVFQNEGALDPDYHPDQILYRDGEMRTIASWIAPLNANHRPLNGLIHAPSGLGKTASMVYLLDKLKDETSGIGSVYINCWKIRSRYSILSEIARQLSIILTKRGYTSEEIWELVESKLKTMKGLVVVLDEAEKLLLKDGQEVLYDLTRTDNISVLLIAQTQEFLPLLDRRSASALNFMEQEYSAYTPEQIRDILQARADIAFSKQSLPEGFVNSCSRIAHEFGSDIRIGIECMRYAGRIAEQAGEKLQLKHVQEARKHIGNAKVKSLIGNLSEQEKNILSVIVNLRKKGPVHTGVLLDTLGESGLDLSRTMVMEYIKRLKQFGLLVTQVKMIDEETGGRSTVVEPIACLKELL